MGFAPIPEREEAIARNVVSAAYRVHKQLGPGLLECSRRLSCESRTLRVFVAKSNSPVNFMVYPQLAIFRTAPVDKTARRSVK